MKIYFLDLSVCGKAYWFCKTWYVHTKLLTTVIIYKDSYSASVCKWLSLSPTPTNQEGAN